MNGFRIININFSQAVTLPPGTYTYGCKAVTPVGTSITFMVGTQTFVIDNLLAGVFQAGFKKTFTIESEALVFYPARTVGDIVYEPQLETGTNASDPGPHPMDIDEKIESAGLEITSEVARIYATKAGVSSEILVMADSINSNVADVSGRVSTVEQTASGIASQVTGLDGRVSTVEQTANDINLHVSAIEDDLLATGINITDKKVEVTADQFVVKGNAGGDPYLMIGVDSDGMPIFKADHIDANFLTAERIEALQVTSKIVRTGAYGSRTEIEGNTMKIFNDTSIFPNIVFGMKNGYAVMEYYDNMGVLLYDLGPNGINMIDVVEEDWIQVTNLLYLGIDYTTVLTTSTIKSKYKRPLIQSQVTYYRYQSQRVGNVVSDPDNDGKLFISPSKTASKIPVGVYCQRQNAYSYDFDLPFVKPSRQHIDNETYITTSAYQMYFQSLYMSSPSNVGYINNSIFDAYWSEKIGYPDAEI